MPKAFWQTADADVGCSLSLVIKICLSALMTTQTRCWVEGGASSGDADGQNHPKGNRRRHRPVSPSPSEPVMGSRSECGGPCTKPRSPFHCLTFAAICVIARSSEWSQPALSILAWPFEKSPTNRRALRQTPRALKANSLMSLIRSTCS